MGSGEEVMYSRYGNNPNQVTLAARYAQPLSAGTVIGGKVERNAA